MHGFRDRTTHVLMYLQKTGSGLNTYLTTSLPSNSTVPPNIRLTRSRTHLGISILYSTFLRFFYYFILFSTVTWKRPIGTASHGDIWQFAQEAETKQFAGKLGE